MLGHNHVAFKCLGVLKTEEKHFVLTFLNLSPDSKCMVQYLKQ